MDLTGTTPVGTPTQYDVWSPFDDYYGASALLLAQAHQESAAAGNANACA